MENYIFITTKKLKLKAIKLKKNQNPNAALIHVEALQELKELKAQEWDAKNRTYRIDGRIALRSTIRARIKYAVGNAPVIYQLRKLIELPKHYALQ